MNKNELIDILQDWNSWNKEQETGIVRKQHVARLKGFLDTNLIVTITGPRRAGKSFIMRQMARSLANAGLDRKQILMINLEDPRYADATVSLLEQIYETYMEFLSPKGAPVIFMDEVQEVGRWEKWALMMHELGKAKIVVSGSNARLLSRELGTLLTGRHIDLTVFPLSFEEFLEFNGMFLRDRLDISKRRIEIKSLFRKYLEWGSFPKVALSEQKKEILLNYFDDIVNKDLLGRFRIRKPGELKSLVRFYLSNASSTVTFSSLEKTLNSSADTIEKFSDYMEQVYLVFFLRRFSYKIREQDKSPRKVYAIDTGLCNAVGFRFSENLGKLAENVVFLDLKRAQILDPGTEIYYWKDEQHREVDFLIKKGLKVTELLQVCWDVANPKTKERETRSLLKAMMEFGLKEAKVITEESETEEKINGRTIKFVPLWKWLLRRYCDD